MESGNTNEKCVLITTEVPVEIAALQWMARLSKITVSSVLRGELTQPQLKQLDNAAYEIMGLPLIIVGHSTQRSKDNRRKRPKLSPKTLDNSIEYILNEYKDSKSDKYIEPRLIVTDYLQRLHKDNDRDNDVSAYSAAVNWAKDVAIWAGCTHILNVQARREVDDYDIKIPMLGDGQWTSNVEQSGDVIFSVHMPKVYNIDVMPALSSWDLPETLVTDNLIYLALLKQKDGVANKCWQFYGNMGTLELHEA